MASDTHDPVVLAVDAEASLLDAFPPLLNRLPGSLVNNASSGKAVTILKLVNSALGLVVIDAGSRVNIQHALSEVHARTGVPEADLLE